jgi:hypothetical protein
MEGVEPSQPGSDFRAPEFASAAARPGASPTIPRLAPAPASTPRLGGLAQSARTKQIKGARNILIFIGALTLLLQGFLFSRTDAEVQVEIDKQIEALPAGQVADPVKVAELKDEWVRATKAIYGGGILFGLAFIILGVLVPKHPVPCTIAGLVLYIGGYAVFGYMNPASLTQGILIKIIIVTGLFKSMQAAIAHQKEQSTDASLA